MNARTGRGDAMGWRATIALLGVAVFVLASSASCTARRSASERFLLDDERPALRIEVADTEQERSRGLSGRRALAEDSGMLFVFGRDQEVAMWGKETYVELDVAFLDASWRIVGISRIEPEDLTPVRSPGEVRYVVEAPRGWFEAHGVEVGDTAERIGRRLRFGERFGM